MIFDGFRNVMASFTSADRVLDYLDEVSIVKDLPEAKDINITKGKLEFKNVKFTYPGFEETTLQGINFSVTEGTHIAFVGPSGAGKSTILQLIQRFYDPQEGEILIDGTNVKEFKQRFLRSQMGFVMQENIFLKEQLKRTYALQNQMQLWQK